MFLKLHTDKQTDRQTNRQTDKQTHLYCNKCLGTPHCGGENKSILLNHRSDRKCSEKMGMLAKSQ